MNDILLKLKQDQALKEQPAYLNQKFSYKDKGRMYEYENLNPSL